jgi:hypothetical protein
LPRILPDAEEEKQSDMPNDWHWGSACCHVKSDA